MTTAIELIAKLSCGAPSCSCSASARRGSGLVHCPSHEDPTPSLNVTEKDGRVLVHCHGNCDQARVIDALRERQLWNGTERAAAVPARRIVATYPYVDRDGALLYEVVRYKPKDFRARRPDGNGGWIWNIEGVARVLYHLPDVRAVAAQGWAVYVVEGEKDADAIVTLGLCATTSVFGAKSKWRAEYADDLAGAAVIVIADKDGSGRKHAQEIAASCRGKATNVKVLELPGDHVKDASDWISAGGTRAELERLAAAPGWTAATDPPLTPPIISGPEIAPGARGLPRMRGDELAQPGDDEDIQYLPILGVDGYLAKGWSHVVAGLPRVGKTELLVASIPAWLGQGHRVLFLSEESVVVWRARLRDRPGDWHGLVVVFAIGADPAALLEEAFAGTAPARDAAIDALQNAQRGRASVSGTTVDAHGNTVHDDNVQSRAYRSDVAVTAAKKRLEDIRDEGIRMLGEINRLGAIRGAKARRAMYEESYPSAPAGIVARVRGAISGT